MAKINIPGSGLWGSIANSLNSNFTELYSTTGWARYGDTTYTSGNPFVLAEGATVDLPNDAGSVITSQLPSGVTAFYDGTVITPENEGDFYDLSIRFTTQSSVNEGTIRLTVDIGGTQGEIVSDVRRLGRGSGINNQLTFAFGVFTLDTFIANGGTVRVESIDGEQSIFDIVYVISRTHRAR